jgi:hypothetical protein
LLKDNTFIAQERDKQRKRSAEDRETKRKEVMSFLEQQESTYKQQAKEYRNIKKKMKR